MNNYFTVQASLDNKEWIELETYPSLEEAVSNCSNTKNNFIVNGYNYFRVILKTINEKIVYVK